MKALYRGNKIFLVLLAYYLSCEKRIASESVLFLVTDKESTPASWWYERDLSALNRDLT